MEEIWKDIEDSNGLYQVSNLGRIKSFIKYKEGRVLKNFKNSSGYYMVILLYSGVRKCKTVHKLVSDAFIPNPENKPCVNHKDANKINNLVSNLEWVTHSENILHAYMVGALDAKKKAKERYKAMSVTNKETNEVANFESMTKLSIHFGVNIKRMSAIVNRKRCVARFSKYEFTRL